MKERPILFSTPMVRALLDGRKTQTRRVLKFEHADESPYGQPGDRLWVRETFQIGYDTGSGDGTYSVIPWTGSDPQRDGKVIYRATFKEPNPDDHGTMPWRSSLFMPRWASRILLEITDVRVQRVQEITEEDAQAEGFAPRRPSAPEGFQPARLAFIATWQALNAKRGYGWDANPWVWAITFRRVTP